VETGIETERRLRAVLAASTRRVHAGTWQYVEFEAAAFPSAARRDALALVRHGAHWSQLVPVLDGESVREPMVVWTFTFPADAPNSGFVGWLASAIKDKTGSGVVVVCGYDEEQGGVYDHWACPAAAGDAVLALIEQLTSPPPAVVTDACALDGLLMNATATAAQGMIGVDTLFRFRQSGERVWADYAGGRVAAGYLVGIARGAELAFRYCQMGHDGTLDGGHSTCRLERLDDGRMQIRERFQWESRPGAGENTITQLAVGRANL